MLVCSAELAIYTYSPVSTHVLCHNAEGWSLRTERNEQNIIGNVLEFYCTHMQTDCNCINIYSTLGTWSVGKDMEIEKI